MVGTSWVNAMLIRDHLPELQQIIFYFLFLSLEVNHMFQCQFLVPPMCRRFQIEGKYIYRNTHPHHSVHSQNSIPYFEIHIYPILMAQLL